MGRYLNSNVDCTGKRNEHGMERMDSTLLLHCEL